MSSVLEASTAVKDSTSFKELLKVCRHIVVMDKIL